MPRFETKPLPPERDAVAPDGSDVRVLLGLGGGSVAHFALGPNETSTAVTHRTVEEIWFVLTGNGQMWREQKGEAEVVDLAPGTCLTIPLGTRFQFRSSGDGPLAAVGVTMPPWPGDGEAIVVRGPWEPTVPQVGRAGSGCRHCARGHPGYDEARTIWNAASDSARVATGAYGTNYARLARVKRQYDPTNLFRMNQNIVPKA